MLLPPLTYQPQARNRAVSRAARQPERQPRLWPPHGAKGRAPKGEANDAWDKRGRWVLTDDCDSSSRTFRNAWKPATSDHGSATPRSVAGTQGTAADGWDYKGNSQEMAGSNPQAHELVYPPRCAASQNGRFHPSCHDAVLPAQGSRHGFLRGLECVQHGVWIGRLRECVGVLVCPV